MERDKLNDFQILKDYAVFRPVANMSLDEAAQLVTSAISHARRNKVRKLLLDITGLTGFEPPSLAARYFFVQDWARAAQGQVSLGFFTRPEMLDPEKIGVVIGENAGVRAEGFTSEAEAVAWLLKLN